MGDLPERMHAGVRAPGAVDRAAFSDKECDGPLEGVLDGIARGLTLPSVKRSPVVGHKQAQA